MSLTIDYFEMKNNLSFGKYNVSDYNELKKNYY